MPPPVSPKVPKHCLGDILFLPRPPQSPEGPEQEDLFLDFPPSLALLSHEWPWAVALQDGASVHPPSSKPRLP